MLRGEVDSSLEREAARVAAESIPGVRGVDNEIRLAYGMVSREKAAGLTAAIGLASVGGKSARRLGHGNLCTNEEFRMP